MFPLGGHREPTLMGEERRGDARERKRRDGEEGGGDGEAWCTVGRHES